MGKSKLKDRIIASYAERYLTIGEIKILPDSDRFQYYRKRELTETEILLADKLFIDELKGQELYDAMFYQMAEATIKRHRLIIYRQLHLIPT